MLMNRLIIFRVHIDGDVIIIFYFGYYLFDQQKESLFIITFLPPYFFSERNGKLNENSAAVIQRMQIKLICR